MVPCGGIIERFAPERGGFSCFRPTKIVVREDTGSRLRRAGALMVPGAFALLAVSLERLPESAPVLLFAALGGVVLCLGGVLFGLGTARGVSKTIAVMRWIVLVFLAAGLIEIVSLAALSWLQPGGLGPLARSHALWGPPERPSPSRIPVDRPPRMVPFYPLYGWRVLPRDLVQKPDWSPRGFRMNRAEGDEVLDPSADLRVVITGGSSVMGWGLKPAATIPSHLERILEERREGDVNVLNAGYPGWFSPQQMALLTQEIFPFYRPDLVVVLDGYNDSLRAMYAGTQRGEEGSKGKRGEHALYDPRLRRHVRQWRRWMTDPFFVINQWLKVSGWKVLIDPSRYGTTVLMRSGLPGSSDSSGDDGARKEGCRETPLRVGPYLASVRSTLGSAAVREVPILYALQPVLVFKPHRTPHERNMLRGIRRAVFAGETFRAPTIRGDWRPFGARAGTCFVKVQKRFYRRARRGFARLQRQFDASRAAVVDLSAMFRDRRTKLFGDWVHYTSRANRLIARRLATRIQRLLGEPDGSSPPARGGGGS